MIKESQAGVKYIKVKLTEKWLGTPAGEILNIVEPQASDMIRRGVAEIVGEKASKAPRNKAVQSAPKIK